LSGNDPLTDIQQGSRNGEWANLMKPVVGKLSAEDLLAIAAYAASRVP
jgi:cytochrome c553